MRVRAAFFLVVSSLFGCGDFEVRLPDPATLVGQEKDYASYQKFVRDAYRAWEIRHENPDNTTCLIDAVTNWEKAWALDPNDKTTLTNLTIGYYYVATYATDDEEAKVAAYQKGYEYGRLAACLNPAIQAGFKADPQQVHMAIAEHANAGDVPAIYWMASNWARTLENAGLAARAVNAPKLKAIQETVYKLGRTYHSGAVHRFFGAFFVKAPAQRDPATQSKEHFERAIAEWGQYLENRVFMAEYYCVFNNDDVLFEKLLKEVINSDPAKDPPGYRFDNHNARKRATKLLSQAPDLF